MSIRRILGNVLGAFIVLSAATINMHPSEPSDIVKGYELAHHLLESFLLAFPLLIPLFFIGKYELLRKICITFLVLGTISFTLRGVPFTIWAVHSGDNLQKIMIPLINIIFLSILVAQFFELREKMYNKLLKQDS